MEHGHLQSICNFFLSYHPFHTVELPLMDDPLEKNFILKKNIALEGSCDMSGHNT